MFVPPFFGEPTMIPSAFAVVSLATLLPSVEFFCFNLFHDTSCLSAFTLHGCMACHGLSLWFHIQKSVHPWWHRMDKTERGRRSRPAESVASKRETNVRVGTCGAWEARRRSRWEMEARGAVRMRRRTAARRCMTCMDVGSTAKQRRTSPSVQWTMRSIVRLADWIPGIKCRKNRINSLRQVNACHCRC